MRGRRRTKRNSKRERMTRDKSERGGGGMEGSRMNRKNNVRNFAL